MSFSSFELLQVCNCANNAICKCVYSGVPWLLADKVQPAVRVMVQVVDPPMAPNTGIDVDRGFNLRILRRGEFDHHKIRAPGARSAQVSGEADRPLLRYGGKAGKEPPHNLLF